MRRLRMLGCSGVFGLALLASACTNSPSPSAQNGSTTSSPPAHGSASTPGSTGAASSTSTSAPPEGPSPKLGAASAWGASAVGFGEVKPAEISLGGDPTGMLTGISWQSWGGDVATGTGTSTYVGPNQTAAQGVQEKATVVASDLGTCGGSTAYQQVKWYFPEQGETLSSGANSTINACSGP